MSIDPRTFRQTVGQFVTGVTVIAIEVDGSIRAMTANSFTSLSLDPPLVLFCLGKETKAGQLIHEVAGSRSTSWPGAAATLVLLRRRLEGRDAAAVLVHAMGGRSAARGLRRRARLPHARDSRRRRSLDRRRRRSSRSTAATAAAAAGVLRRTLSSLAGEDVMRAGLLAGRTGK